MNRFTTTALITLASAFLALSPPAFAADPAFADPAFANDDIVPQATLNVAHTDFTSAKSVAQLKSRIRHTAYAMCTANSDGRTLMTTDQRACYDTAMQDGLAQVDSKSLTARRQTSPEMAVAQPQEHSTH